MAYRERWGRDVVIDLIGYRRYGHNETDEPAYTQPLMAAKIKEHPPVSRDLRRAAGQGGRRHRRTRSRPTRNERQRGAAATTLKELRAKIEAGEYEDPTVDRSAPASSTAPSSPSVETAVSEKRLRTLNEELLRVPDSFTIHRKLRKPLAQADRDARARAGSSSATPRRSPSPRC